MRETLCRNCGSSVDDVLIDLGMSPLANAFLRADQLNAMEPFYPLKVLVCASCYLVQLEEFETPARIFSDYVYFSSWSSSWLAHAKRFAETAIDRLELGPTSKVIELASNDGYLLQYFAEQGIPVLGVEPASNVAAVALDRGIPTHSAFFGMALGRELAQGQRPDLIVANNVLAHVPDLHDFVEGVRILLHPNGWFSAEFPHLLRLIDGLQFDTIYHEHFSYLSLTVVEDVFERHGLRVEEVEELPTHGGSLRVWARHERSSPLASAARLKVLADERDAGLCDLGSYSRFAGEATRRKRELLRALIDCKERGDTVAAHGAAAKGNTLLNYCGVRADLIDFVVDVSPHKQGLFLPGTHLPVFAPDALKERQPDVVLILPWNIQEEILDSIGFVREWGGRFLVQHPDVAIVD